MFLLFCCLFMVMFTYNNCSMISLNNNSWTFVFWKVIWTSLDIISSKNTSYTCLGTWVIFHKNRRLFWETLPRLQDVNFSSKVQPMQTCQGKHFLSKTLFTICHVSCLIYISRKKKKSWILLSPPVKSLCKFIILKYKQHLSLNKTKIKNYKVRF